MPERLRRPARGHAQRLQRRHAALHEGPHLPVRSEALHLAVAAQQHAAAGIHDLLRRRRDVQVVPVVGRSPSRCGCGRARRRTPCGHVALQPLVLPELVVLVEPLARPRARRRRRAAWACRRSRSSRTASPRPGSSGVDRSACSIVVWPSRIIVMSVSRSPPPSGTTSMPLLARGLQDPLALLAPRLHVGLDRERAQRLQPPHVLARVVQALDRSRARGVVGAVQDEPGREDARPGHHAGLDHLRLRRTPRACWPTDRASVVTP